MKVLVTGAMGFCGRHLVRRLAGERGVSVIGVDRHPSAPQAVPVTEYYCCDITAEGALTALIERLRPDGVCHLAGLFTAPPPALYRANLLTVVELLEAVRCHAPGARVVIVGSAAEYGHVTPDRLPITEDVPCAPITVYGRTKHAATQAALDYARRGVRVAVVRPFNIVGAGVPASLVVGAVLDRMTLALKRGDEEVRVGNLDCARDFVAVNDVVDAYANLMTHDVPGEVFNVCSGRPMAIRSVVTTLLSYAPRPLRPVVDPALCRPDDVPVVYGNCERAQRAFGFSPVTPVEHALRAAWDDLAGEGHRP